MGLGGGTQSEPRDSPPSVPEAPRVKRKAKCKWISWDDEGRPSCKHGPAFKGGFNTPGVQAWRCRKAHTVAHRAWEQTEKGKAVRKRANQTPGARSAKAFYEVTRIKDPF